jgi:hypothetical protein
VAQLFSLGVMPRVIQIRASMSTGSWTKHSLRLRNLAFYKYGHEFLDTAKKTGSPLVRSYLYGHALELFLKAYLFDRGMTHSQARSFGHNETSEKGCLSCLF